MIFAPVNRNNIKALSMFPRRDLLTERVGFEPTEGCPSNDFESFAFDHSATSPNRAEPCKSRLGPRGCGACSHAGSAPSNNALPPTRPSTFCATERDGRTGRRFWWAGLRDGASATDRTGTHVGAHTLLAEAVAVMAHLQLPLTRTSRRTTKDQAWTAELTTG